jgi:hypothetical protein
VIHGDYGQCSSRTSCLWKKKLAGLQRAHLYHNTSALKPYVHDAQCVSVYHLFSLQFYFVQLAAESSTAFFDHSFARRLGCYTTPAWLNNLGVVKRRGAVRLQGAGTDIGSLKAEAPWIKGSLCPFISMREVDGSIHLASPFNKCELFIVSLVYSIVSTHPSGQGLQACGKSHRSLWSLKWNELLIFNYFRSLPLSCLVTSSVQSVTGKNRLYVT